MIGSGVIEVMTDRVTHTDTDYAPTALDNIVAVRVLASLDTSPGNIWFETDVKLVTLSLAGVIVDAAKDRVPRCGIRCVLTLVRSCPGAGQSSNF